MCVWVGGVGFFFLGGGSGWINEEFVKTQKKSGRGSSRGGGVRGQGECERRSEVYVKNSNKISGGGLGQGGDRVGRGSGWI